MLPFWLLKIDIKKIYIHHTRYAPFRGSSLEYLAFFQASMMGLLLQKQLLVFSR